MNLGLEIKSVDKKVIQEKIEFAINPNNMNGLEFYEKKLTRISKEDLISSILLDLSEYFYLEYARGRVKKVYIAPKDVLLVSLREQIFPERREGLDLTILTNNLKGGFMTSHDGEIYNIII